MTLSELEKYLCSGDFRVESDGDKIWLEGPDGWRLTEDDPPGVRLILAEEPDFLRKMLPQLQALHVMDRIAAALTVCRNVSTADLRRAARACCDGSESDPGENGASANGLTHDIPPREHPYSRIR